MSDESEKALARAWAALGVDPKEAADDPDTADLADSIRVSLQHERDERERAVEMLAVGCGLSASDDSAQAVATYIQRLQRAARGLIDVLHGAGLAMQEMEGLEAAIEARDERRIVRAPARRYLAEGSFDALLLSVEHKMIRSHQIVVVFAFQIEKSSNPKLLPDDRVEYVVVLRDHVMIEVAEAHARALENQAVSDTVGVAVERSRGRGETGNARIELRLPVQLDVEERELAVDPSKRAVLIVKMRRRA